MRIIHKAKHRISSTPLCEVAIMKHFNIVKKSGFLLCMLLATAAQANDFVKKAPASYTNSGDGASDTFFFARDEQYSVYAAAIKTGVAGSCGQRVRLQTSGDCTSLNEDISVAVCNPLASSAIAEVDKEIKIDSDATQACQITVVASDNTESYKWHEIWKLKQEIQWDSVSTPQYAGGSTVQVKAVGLIAGSSDETGIAPTYVSETTDVCSVSGNTVTHITSGDCRIRASIAESSHFSAASSAYQWTVQKQSQSIVFSPANAPSPLYMDESFTASVSATSGLVVDVAVTGNCNYTMLAGSVTLTPVTSGTCDIIYSQAGNAQFDAAPQVQQSVVFSKREQTITLSPAGNIGKYIYTDFSATATASSGLNVDITVTSGSCSSVIDGNKITITSTVPTVCKINYNQPGNNFYNAAPVVTQSVYFFKRYQYITYTPNQSPVEIFVDETFSATATAQGSGLPVDISVSGTCTGSIAGNSVTITPTTHGVCTISYNQAGNEIYNPASQVSQTVNINRHPQTITANAPDIVNVGDIFDVSAAVTNGEPVTITASGGCQLESGGSGVATIEVLSVPQCILHYYEDGSMIYDEVVYEDVIEVAPGEQGITVIQSAPQYAFVDNNFKVAAQSSSGLDVTIAATGSCRINNATPPEATIRPFEQGVCTITYTQNGDPNYNAANTIVEEVLVREGQVITATSPFSGQYNDTVSVSAVASSGLPVSITPDGEHCRLEPDSGSVAQDNAVLRLTAIGICKVTYEQPGDDTYEPAPVLTKSIVVEKWAQSIEITLAPPASELGNRLFRVEAVATPVNDPDNPRAVGIAISGDCTLSNGGFDFAEILLNETGDICTIYFNQPGDAQFLPAAQLSRNVIISQATDGDDIGLYWITNKLFTTGTAANGAVQPIMSPPMIARNGDVKADAPNLMVIFGTGKYHEESDLPDKALRTIYGVHDRGVYDLTRYAVIDEQTQKTMLEKRVFTEHQISNTDGETQRNRKSDGENVDWGSQFGWYVDLFSDLNNNGVLDSLEQLGERSVFRPFIANKLYIFNTVIPTVGTCDGATQGWTMLIDWTSGLAPKFATYDANMDGTIDSNDAGFIGYFNETAGSELGRGGDNIYDTSGDEARRRSVIFGAADAGVRLGWEEKQPYGIIAE